MSTALSDPDGEIRSQIGRLYPDTDPGSTPTGRAAALDLDTCLVYAELYHLLIKPPGDPTELGQTASDLVGELLTLHRHTERVYAAWDAARWAR